MGIINFIKRIFNRNAVQQKEVKFKALSNAYYFHEDSYCQIQYLPKENFSNASKMAIEIEKHSEERFDGYGWTDCYIRDSASFPTKTKNFKVPELAELLLQQGFNEYPGVTTGYSSAVFPCPDTRAFKKKSIIICFNFKDDIIQNIWHNLSPSKGDNGDYKTFLLTMSGKYNLLLADWWKSIIIDISKPDEIDKYFAYKE